jgi:hypothetical protein
MQAQLQQIVQNIDFLLAQFTKYSSAAEVSIPITGTDSKGKVKIRVPFRVEEIGIP